MFYSYWITRPTAELLEREKIKGKFLPPNHKEGFTKKITKSWCFNKLTSYEHMRGLL